jgi:hypothetical protein
MDMRSAVSWSRWRMLRFKKQCFSNICIFPCNAEGLGSPNIVHPTNGISNRKRSSTHMSTNLNTNFDGNSDKH